MAQHTDHFGISPKLQELLCMMGQSYVFEDGEELLSHMLNIDISSKQIQRVSEHYGGVIEEQFLERESVAPVVRLKEKEDKVYMMVDGSMIYTREEGWKEMKVGRLFAGADCIPIQNNRNQITESIYVCATFKLQMQLLLVKGIEDNCPSAVQILDFFHAVEKISLYASVQYPNLQERQQWIETQKQRLLNDEVTVVITTLEQEDPLNSEAKKLVADVIRYYQNNRKRMQYKTYQDKKYLIGSGAIESAHRNVVQQRLKLSGQRWSKKGAQQIVNLRVYKKSNRWTELIDLIKKAA